jgi:arylsulfatase A-like enzyme
MFRQSDEDFQAARVFRQAIDWLEQNHTHKQFYLYVDSFDPHEPFEAPQRFLDLYDPGYEGPRFIYGNLYKRSDLNDREHHNVRARYAAEVSLVDHWIGQLLETVDRLGLRENTLIVLLSDHGKILGEFGVYGMPPQCTGLALTPVPCFLRHPGGENRDQRFSGWVYNIDITATVLDLLEVDPKPGNVGRSVWSAVSSSADRFREHLVCGHAPSVVSAWEEDWLYLVDTEPNAAALYNLADDPSRQTDVSDRYPSVRDDLARKLAAVAEPS